MTLYRKPVTPLPIKLITTLKYCTSFAISASPNMSTYIFNAGSIWDPDFTAIGNQPRGRDQLFTMYDHAVVIGSKATLHAIQDPNVATNISLAGIALKDSGTPSTSNEFYTEGTECKWGLLGIRDGVDKVFTMNYSPKKFLGISHPLSASELKNSAASGPAESAYYHILNGQVDGTQGGNLVCYIEIDYTCAFIEPKQPPQS